MNTAVLTKVASFDIVVDSALVNSSQLASRAILVEMNYWGGEGMSRLDLSL